MELPQVHTDALQQLMQQADISSFKALARAAGISSRQILKLRRGEVEQMRVSVLLKLSQVLKVPLGELVATFTKKQSIESSVSQQEYAQLKREYLRLQTLLEQQQQTLQQEFQQSSLQVLESWLVQWPTAAHKAQENPQLPAVRLLPLMRSLEQLLQQWQVEAIAPVGTEAMYDPQLHQLLEGTAQPGDRVKIRYPGYFHNGKLFNRAKVSPILENSGS